MSGRAARRATAYLSARTQGCCCRNRTRIDIDQRLLLIALAGLPTAIEYASTSLTTTDPAPTTHPSPMRTPGRMHVPIPIQQLAPISTGRVVSHPCSVTGRVGSSFLWLAVWIIV